MASELRALHQAQWRHRDQVRMTNACHGAGARTLGRYPSKVPRSPVGCDAMAILLPCGSVAVTPSKRSAIELVYSGAEDVKHPRVHDYLIKTLKAPD